MMQLFRSKPSRSHISALRPDKIIRFHPALPCQVTDAIRVISFGRVKVNGYSWQAELSIRFCQTTLLPGQPALAIGRKGNVLIVVPYHCPL